MIRVFITALALVSAPLQAQIYQCINERGKPVFSDSPCGEAAKQIHLENRSSGLSMSVEGMENVARANQVRKAERDIAKAERRIALLMQEKRRKIARIDHDAQFAADNIAGATYLDSLAKEKQAVIDDYNLRIDLQRDLIKRIESSLQNSVEPAQ